MLLFGTNIVGFKVATGIDQLSRRHLECGGEANDVNQSDVAVPPFYIGNIGSMQVGILGQLFLRYSKLMPMFTNGPSEPFQYTLFPGCHVDIYCPMT